MARFSRCCREVLYWIGSSSPAGRGSAPPCVRRSRPWLCSAWRSRRTVAAETPNSWARVTTSTLPFSTTRSRISPIRSAFTRSS